MSDEACKIGRDMILPQLSPQGMHLDHREQGHLHVKLLPRLRFSSHALFLRRDVMTNDMSGG